MSWTLNMIFFKTFIMVAVLLPSIFKNDFYIYVALLFSLDPNQWFQLYVSEASHKGIFNTVTQLIIFLFILYLLAFFSLINSNTSLLPNLKTCASSSILHFPLPYSSSPESASQQTVDYVSKILRKYNLSSFFLLLLPYSESWPFNLDHCLAPCKLKHIILLLIHKTI